MLLNKYFFTSLLLCLLTTAALHAQPPDWVVDNLDQYAHQASIIGELQIDDVVNHSLNNKIAFFVGNEVRAVAEPRQLSDNRAVYNLYVVSNQGIGETMDIRVYVGAEDLVYTANTAYDFVKNDIRGNYEEPFTIWVAPTNDAPIDFSKIPQQTVLEGNNVVIDLADYLITTDNDPVAYDYNTNNNLNVVANGSQLTISGVSGYGGTTVLTVRATETAGVNYDATTFIRVKVNKAFVPPNWAMGEDAFAGLQTNPDGSFQSVNLNDYEFDYDGDCLEFSIEPVIPVTGTTNLPPDWQVDHTEFQYNMLITAQVQFTDYFQFINPNDLLGAFVNGRRRGAISPHLEGNTVRYNLIIYGDYSGEIVNLKFYSHEHQRIFDLPIEFPFFPYLEDGSPDHPKILDVAPLKTTISAVGDLSVEICDPEWAGDQEFKIIAYDCNYPDQSDEMTVTYTVSDEVLALELINFTGEVQPNTGIQLQWQIAEYEASLMHVERLNNGAWAHLTEINTKASKLQYQWLDNKPKSGENYYRLRLIDAAGAVTYSPTIVVLYEELRDWTVYPNPAQDNECWLHYKGSIDEVIHLQLFSPDGKLRYHKMMSLAAVQNTIRLDLSGLTTGLYYLRINNDTQKIIVRQ